MKVMSGVLLVLGGVVILYALFMDTTVSSGYGRVHNLGLQADRQLLLILGCFLALIGVVLFAVWKLKQTPEQEVAATEARRTAITSVNEAASRVTNQVTAATTKHSAGFLVSVEARLRKAKDDNLIGRIMVGGFVALCTAPASSSLLPSWWLLPLFVVLYSLLGDRPGSDLMRSMLRFNVWWTLSHAVLFAFFMLGMDDWRSDGILSTTGVVGAVAMVAPVGLTLVCTGISLAAIAYLRRRNNHSHQNISQARE